jgi:hypothetical protein
MYRVSKSFGASGKILQIGEIVDGKKYKWLDKLITNGYLTELDKSVEPVKCQLCERQFVDEPTLEAHYLTEHPNDVVLTDDKEDSKQ